jgi:carboxylesterase
MGKKKRVNKIFLVFLIIIATILILLLKTNFEKPIFRENSIDNPESKKHSDTQPSMLEGSEDSGVILIHGLGATAWETKKLAEYLNKNNITTSQVLLAGHGANIYDFEKTTSQQWYNSVEQAYNSLNTKKKVIIGSSLGALLAIELTQKNNPDGIIILSVPIYFNDKRIKYTPILKYFQRYSHRDINKEHQPFYHENFPVKALAKMIDYINKVKPIIPKINTPALIIQSNNDTRLDSKSAQYLYDNIASEEKEIMWLNSNQHVLIIDYEDENQEFKNERKEIFEKIHKFIIETN